MKQKKLKKLAKLLHEEVRNYEQEIKTVSTHEDVDWSEYDPEVSDKFRKMILNLLDYKNNININIESNRIYISTNDIRSIKTTLNSKYTDDNYFEMRLVKNLGFTINYGYKFKSNYKDEKLFDELHPIIAERLREINSDNFKEIWTLLMKESGILRDNNLDEVLNG